LQKQYLVILRDRHQLAQIGFSAGMDVDELLAAMTHFHDRHAAALPVEHLRRGLPQYRLREDSRTSAEIEYARHQRGSCFVAVVGFCER